MGPKQSISYDRLKPAVSCHRAHCGPSWLLMESGNDSDSPSGQVSGSKQGKAQRNEGLQAKNREAQRRFRERQRVSSSPAFIP